MITLSILKDLLSLLEEYQENKPSKPSSQDFVQWVFTKLTYESNSESPTSSVVTDSMEGELDKDVFFSFLLFRVYKHVSRYSRRVLAEEGIRALDEYSMLSTIVLSNTKLTKTEVIKANLVEIPAGMEIINRLEKKGWISLVMGDKDKRSKMVIPTLEGRTVIQRCNAKMDPVAQLMRSGLDRAEVQLMTRILTKVDGIQTEYYNRLDSSDPSEILQKRSERNKK